MPELKIGVPVMVKPWFQNAVGHKNEVGTVIDTENLNYPAVLVNFRGVKISLPANAVESIYK